MLRNVIRVLLCDSDWVSLIRPQSRCWLGLQSHLKAQPGKVCFLIYLFLYLCIIIMWSLDSLWGSVFKLSFAVVGIQFPAGYWTGLLCPFLVVGQWSSSIPYHVDCAMGQFTAWQMASITVVKWGSNRGKGRIFYNLMLASYLFYLILFIRATG